MMRCKGHKGLQLTIPVPSVSKLFLFFLIFFYINTLYLRLNNISEVSIIPLTSFPFPFDKYSICNNHKKKFGVSAVTTDVADGIWSMTENSITEHFEVYRGIS
jgi:hypothetical protein